MALEIHLADDVSSLACNALLSAGRTICSSEPAPLPSSTSLLILLSDSPEDLAWQNRVETRLDTLTSAVDSLITFLQAQGPLPCPLMGAGAAQLVPTPDQSTPQTMMYGGTPPVSSSVTAQMPNQPLMPPGAYIPVAPPPELHMPPQHQRAQSQADTQRLSRSASTAASSSTQPLEQPRQRSSSMPPPEAPVRAATRARSSSASHNLSMWAKPRPGVPSGAAVSATEPPPPAVPTPQPGPSASSSNSQADTNGSPSTRPNGHAPQAQAQAQASTQGQTQVASDTGTPIHEPLSKTRLSGLALRKSLSHAQRQQLEQALASQAAKEAEAEQAAQGTRRQSGSGSGSGSSNSSTSSGRPTKRARRESSRAPQNT